MFCVISSAKLHQFRYELAAVFLNEFVTKWYKCFPLHRNNVSTLPCEIVLPYGYGCLACLGLYALCFIDVCKKQNIYQSRLP